jgi:hypothetical protein
MVIDILQEFKIVWPRHNFSSFFLAVKKKLNKISKLPFLI